MDFSVGDNFHAPYHVVVRYCCYDLDIKCFKIIIHLVVDFVVWLFNIN